MKKKDVGTFKDNEKKPHNVASCQVYDKEYETTSIHETMNVNQDERIRLNELRETIHLDVKRRLDNEINNENYILFKEMSYAPVNEKRRGTESESDSLISSKATSNSIPTADLSLPNSTPITSTYSSKLLPAQNQSI